MLLNLVELNDRHFVLPMSLHKDSMVSSFIVMKGKPVLIISLYRLFHCTYSCRCCRYYCNDVSVQFVLVQQIHKAQQCACTSYWNKLFLPLVLGVEMMGCFTETALSYFLDLTCEVSSDHFLIIFERCFWSLSNLPRKSWCDTLAAPDVAGAIQVLWQSCIAIISLIFQLNACTQLNICILFTKYLVHSLVLTALSSGRTVTSSQNHLLIVRLFQWLMYRAWNISCGVFTELFTFVKTILAHCGLKVLHKY